MATVCDHRLDPRDYGIQECRLFVERKIRPTDKVEISANKAMRNAHRATNYRLGKRTFNECKLWVDSLNALREIQFHSRQLQSCCYTILYIGKVLAN